MAHFARCTTASWVRRITAEEKTAGGIIIPDTARERSRWKAK